MTDWNDALAVLQAAYEASMQKEQAPYVTPKDVNERLGREADDPRTARALHDLARTAYLDVLADSDQTIAPSLFQLSEKGLSRTSARWPSANEDAVEIFLSALQAQAEAAESPEERDRLKRAANALVGLGRDTLANVLAAVITRGA